MITGEGVRRGYGSGMVDGSTSVVALVVALIGIIVIAVMLARQGARGRDLGGIADKVTFATLHTVALASPHLREGLTPTGASRAAKHLRGLLGTSAVALTDGEALLAWDGAGKDHADDAVAHAGEALRSGRTIVLDASKVACDDPDCPIRTAVIAPLTSEDRLIGTLIAYGVDTTANLVRATEEVAEWVSSQVELAELDLSRTRTIEAELRALRAQISPHFIYNSLAAIASFVRTDPERARDLLLEFADFTRYAFRRGGDFTTLADELKNIERYLVLEQARFGDRLQTKLIIAPEVLQVAVPFLAVQPLVENAVRHGLEGKEGPGHVTIGAEDSGPDALIWVEDDGAGVDPELVRRALAGETDADPTPGGGNSVGMGNVDARLRQVFGDAYGLVVETAPGAGTKVSFRIPKFAPGVRVR